MESKQLSKIVLLLALTIGINTFSQMKMADIEGKKFSINSKTEKRNVIKYLMMIIIVYFLDRRDFDFKKRFGC